MSALNCSSQPDPLPPSTRPPVGVLQIGGGNFLRAFADWMMDVAPEWTLRVGNALDRIASVGLMPAPADLLAHAPD